MTLNINQIMNSVMMPHVSPRWMSHGVSVVMILVNIDNVMATPQFIFQQHMKRRTIDPWYYIVGFLFVWLTLIIVVCIACLLCWTNIQKDNCN